MSSRLNAILDRITGQSVGLTNYENLVADVNYLAIGGAAIAAVDASISANTLTITSQFHKVTAVTGNVDSINDALGPIAGQTVNLLFANVQTIRNNGGGTGNIRTYSGYPRIVAAGELIRAVFDGTNWWVGEAVAKVIYDSGEIGSAVALLDSGVLVIPAWTNTIKVRLTARGTTLVSKQSWGFRMGTGTIDSGTHYGYRWDGGGASVAQSSASGVNGDVGLSLWFAPDAAAFGTNLYGNAELIIQDVQNANLMKQGLVRQGQVDLSTSGGPWQMNGWFSWSGQTVPNRFATYFASGNVAIGSRMEVIAEP
jgi:hypothetical protein